MEATAPNQTAYMIRPTEWSDTIIRPHASAQAKARVRAHAGLLSLWMMLDSGFWILDRAWPRQHPASSIQHPESRIALEVTK